MARRRQTAATCLRLTAQETQAFSSFGFLSRKPALVTVNCEMERATADVTDAEHAAVRAHGLEVFRLAAAFESELWELDDARPARKCSRMRASTRPRAIA